jgi:hypothetical protein
MRGLPHHLPAQRRKSAFLEGRRSVGLDLANSLIGEADYQLLGDILLMGFQAGARKKRPQADKPPA